MGGSDAHGEVRVVRIARVMLQCARADPSLVDRQCPPHGVTAAADLCKAGVPEVGLINRPERLSASGSPFGRSVQIAIGHKRRATSPGGSRDTGSRQHLPFVRYVVPAACTTAVLLGLVAMMPPDSHRRTPAPTEVAVAARPPEIDGSATLTALRTRIAQEEQQIARLIAERDGLRAQISALSAEVAGAIDATQRLAASNRQAARSAAAAQDIAPATLPTPPPQLSDASVTPGQARSIARNQPRTEPASKPSHEMSGLSRQLLLARAALVSGDRLGARSMIKQAQTLMVFEPAGVGPAHAGAVAAQISQTLMMLSDQNDGRALQHLNQALMAVAPAS